MLLEVVNPTVRVLNTGGGTCVQTGGINWVVVGWVVDADGVVGPHATVCILRVACVELPLAALVRGNFVIIRPGRSGEGEKSCGCEWESHRGG